MGVATGGADWVSGGNGWGCGLNADCGGIDSGGEGTGSDGTIGSSSGKGRGRCSGNRDGGAIAIGAVWLD